MATKKNEKDTIIENLKEENNALRKISKISSWFNSLSKKKKILLLALSLFLLFSFISYFVYMSLSAVRPVTFTKDEYKKILSEINKREWSIKDKDNLKLLNSYLSSEVDGTLKTTHDGDVLILSFDKRELFFLFTDGKVKGKVSSYICYFEYSESSIKTGRAITLSIGEDKVVFYEKY